MSVPENLEEHNITVPQLAAPAASYMPFTQSGKILFISGQLPFADGELFRTGHLGLDVSLEDGQKAAEICGLNVLGQIANAVENNLDRVTKVLKLEILVASSADFSNAHMVANGASDLMLKVFGQKIGAHARVAYSVVSLPLNACVEIAATIEVQ